MPKFIQSIYQLLIKVYFCLFIYVENKNSRTLPCMANQSEPWGASGYLQSHLGLFPGNMSSKNTEHLSNIRSWLILSACQNCCENCLKLRSSRILGSAAGDFCGLCLQVVLAKESVQTGSDRRFICVQSKGDSSSTQKSPLPTENCHRKGYFLKFGTFPLNEKTSLWYTDDDLCHLKENWKQKGINLLTLMVMILLTGVLLGPGTGRKTGSWLAGLERRMTYGSVECEG